MGSQNGNKSEKKEWDEDCSATDAVSGAIGWMRARKFLYMVVMCCTSPSSKLTVEKRTEVRPFGRGFQVFQVFGVFRVFRVFRVLPSRM